MATTPPVPIYNQGPSVTHRNLPPQYDPNAAYKVPPSTGGVDIQGDNVTNGGFYDRWRANRLPPRPRTVLQPGGGQMPIGVKPLPDPTVRLGLGGGYPVTKGPGGDPRMQRGSYDQRGGPERGWGEDYGFHGSGPIMRPPGGKGGYQGGLEDWLIPDGNGGYRSPGPDENGGWMHRGNGQGPQVDMGDNRLMPHPGVMTSFNDKGEAARGNWGSGEMSPEDEEYYRQQMAHNSGMQYQGQQQVAHPQQGQLSGGRAPLRPGMQYRPRGGQRPMGGNTPPRGGMQPMIPDQGQQQMPQNPYGNFVQSMRPGSFYGAW